MKKISLSGLFRHASFLKTIRIRKLLMLIVAGIINAVGVTLLLAPAGIYDSGFSGTAMLLWELTPEYLLFSYFLLALNLPFFIFGLKKQGSLFTFYSLFAVGVYSLSSFILIKYFGGGGDVSPIAGTDLLLCALFGGLISGVGSGLTIRTGGALDGVEIMAVIFARKIGITVGTFIMCYNAVLYIVVGIVTGSFVLPLYSVLAYMVGIKAVDFIVEGFDRAKAATIITREPDAVARALSLTFGSGVTLLDGRGYYSAEAKAVIYFVVNRFQIGLMKSVVLSCDPEAFISVTDVAELLGGSRGKSPLHLFRRRSSIAAKAQQPDPQPAVEAEEDAVTAEEV